jgi:hypothetical protein
MNHKKATPYQLAQAGMYADQWRARGLSTDPADRDLAEISVLRLRGMMGLRARPTFVWCDSPIAAFGKLIAAVKDRSSGKMMPLNDAASLEAGARQGLVSSHQGIQDILGRLQFFSQMAETFFHWTRLRSKVQDMTSEVSEKLARAAARGQLAANIVAVATYTRDVLNDTGTWSNDVIDAHRDLALSACMWWNHEDKVFMSERPSHFALDERNRFHSTEGPAIAFRDGFKIFHLHGVEVPAKFVEDTANLTPDNIDEQWNVEVRRVLMELYGFERYLRRSGAQIIHEGRDGRRLWWRMPSEKRTRSNEPVVMVEVKNSTPEPDGSFKTYWLRVPPHIRNADEAVAWTFRVDTIDYLPRKET